MTTAATSMAAAVTEVVTALNAGSLPVERDLDRATPVLGRQLRVGDPKASAQIVGGVCAAWEYEVTVTVVAGVDDLDQLVGDTDTTLGLLAAANITCTAAEPSVRPTAYNQHVPVYDITCQL